MWQVSPFAAVNLVRLSTIDCGSESESKTNILEAKKRVDKCQAQRANKNRPKFWAITKFHPGRLTSFFLDFERRYRDAQTEPLIFLIEALSRSSLNFFFGEICRWNIESIERDNVEEQSLRASSWTLSFISTKLEPILWLDKTNPIRGLHRLVEELSFWPILWEGPIQVNLRFPRQRAFG